MDEGIKKISLKFLQGKRLTNAEKEILQEAPGDLSQWKDFLFGNRKNLLPPGYHKNLPFRTPALKKYFKDGRLSLFVPEKLSMDSPSPLILFLHGGDQNSPMDAPWEYYLGPKGSLRQFMEKNSCILAAASAMPAADGKRWNRTGVKKYLELLLEELDALFHIDPDRKILAGYSMGGFGAYHQGQLLHDHFSCVLLGAGGWWASDFGNFTGTSVVILHGKMDCSPDFKGGLPQARHHDWCGFSFGKAAHLLLKKRGIPHTTLFHNGGHSLFGKEAAEAMEKFFLLAPETCRDPYPEKLYISTPAGSCDPLLEDHLSSFYCDILTLETGDIVLDRITLSGPNIAENNEDVKKQTFHLSSQIQSGGMISLTHVSPNFFRVESKNISRFRIFLSPEKTDFTKEVVVEWNNVKKSYSVTPRIQTLLESYLRKKDKKMLFPAVIEIKPES